MEVLLVPEDLVLTKPVQTDMKWVVTVGDSAPMRLTPDLARVLNWYMDGKPGTIDSYLGISVTTQQLETATTLLVQSGLLVNPENVHGGGGVTRNKTASLVSPRFKFNSLFSIQFAFLNRPRHFAWLTRVATRPLLLGGAITSIIFAVTGLVLIGVKFQEFESALTAPQTPPVIFGLIVFVVLVASLHEFAHAAALVYFGEGPRRIGIMLFYLIPAFFCDITNAWRLPNKNQRVLIALAGVVSTFGIAGIVATIYAVTDTKYSWLAIAAVILYIESVLNLLPFIKLDGYIALMAYLDESKLRDSAMDEWKYFLLLLVSRKWEKIKKLRAPRIIFGLGASLTPILILLFLASSFASASTGITVSIITGLLFLTIALLLLRGVQRIYTIGNRMGSFQGNILQRILAAGIGAMLIILAGFIPLPRTESGSYWEANGALVTNVVVPAGANSNVVELRQTGLFVSQVVGTGTVTNETTSSEVPIQALSPNIIIDGYLPEQTATLLIDYEGERLEAPGSVTLALGYQPLYMWIFNTIT